MHINTHSAVYQAFCLKRGFAENYGTVSSREAHRIQGARLRLLASLLRWLGFALLVAGFVSCVFRYVDGQRAPGIVLGVWGVALWVLFVFARKRALAYAEDEDSSRQAIVDHHVEFLRLCVVIKVMTKMGSEALEAMDIRELGDMVEGHLRPYAMTMRQDRHQTGTPFSYAEPSFDKLYEAFDSLGIAFRDKAYYRSLE